MSRPDRRRRHPYRASDCRRQSPAAVLHIERGPDQVTRAFGRASSPATPFLLASITKPMTATCVMILSDRKALTISDPVRKFIPEFSGADRDAITIENLLTHTS